MKPAFFSPEIEQQQLLQLLSGAHATPEILQCKQNTVSTNDDVMTLYQQGYRSALVISQQQSQGRGQSQREWLSPIGNIYLSALVKLDRPIDGRFSLECGLNILHCPAFSQLSHLKLKWANDLYSSLGKWGGILVEPIDSHHVIIGVGINTYKPEEYLKIPQPVTSLQELGMLDIDRIDLIHQIYLALLEAVKWFNFDCQNLAKRFNHVAAFKDQWITIERQQQENLMGYFRGIQDDGALLIQQPTEFLATVCYDGRIVIPV